MDSESELQGGSSSGTGPVEPLEPSRPDVMPNPPPGEGGRPSTEGEISLDADDDAPIEGDMADVEVNNSVSDESPQGS